MRKPTLLIIIVLLSICRCGRNNNSFDNFSNLISDSTIMINVHPTNDVVSFDHIFKDIKIIHLKEELGNIIGSVDKIISHNQNFYLLDKRISKRIFVYDSTGTFKFHIGRVGRGPGEYIEPTDFTFIGDEVLVLDQFSHRMLKYSNQGDFLSDIETQLSFSEIEYVSDSHSLIARAGYNNGEGHENYELLEIDTLGHLISEYLPNPCRINYSSGAALKNGYEDGEIIYSRGLFPGVFSFSSMGVTSRYLFEIDNGLPHEFENNCKGDFETFMNKYNSYSYFSGNLLDTQRYLFFTVISRKAIIYGIYDKETKKTVCGPPDISGIMSNDINAIAASAMMNGYARVYGDLILCTSSSELFSQNSDKEISNRDGTSYCIVMAKI